MPGRPTKGFKSREVLVTESNTYPFRLNSEKFSDFDFQAKIVIFEGKSQK